MRGAIQRRCHSMAYFCSKLADSINRPFFSVRRGHACARALGVRSVRGEPVVGGSEADRTVFGEDSDASRMRSYILLRGRYWITALCANGLIRTVLPSGAKFVNNPESISETYFGMNFSFRALADCCSSYRLHSLFGRRTHGAEEYDA